MLQQPCISISITKVWPCIGLAVPWHKMEVSCKSHLVGQLFCFLCYLWRLKHYKSPREVLLSKEYGTYYCCHFVCRLCYSTFWPINRTGFLSLTLCIYTMWLVPKSALICWKKHTIFTQEMFNVSNTQYAHIVLKLWKLTTVINSICFCQKA